MSVTHTRHDIEHRAPEKWIARSIEHLSQSITNQNASDTLRGVCVLVHALNDITASRGLR